MLSVLGSAMTQQHSERPDFSYLQGLLRFPKRNKGTNLSAFPPEPQLYFTLPLCSEPWAQGRVCLNHQGFESTCHQLLTELTMSFFSFLIFSWFHTPLILFLFDWWPWQEQLWWSKSLETREEDMEAVVRERNSAFCLFLKQYPYGCLVQTQGGRLCSGRMWKLSSGCFYFPKWKAQLQLRVRREKWVLEGWRKRKGLKQFPSHQERWSI